MPHASPARLCTFLAIVVLGLSGCGPDLARNVDFERGLQYGSGWVISGDGFAQRDLLFDWLEPNDIPRENRPAVVMIHGGGFDSGGRDDDQLFALANQLATNGYVCFLIDYRLLPDVPPAPDDFDIIDDIVRLKQFDYSLERIQDAIHAASVDAKTAMRHVRENAATYGVDPNRIAILGESAGGFAAFGAGVTGSTTFAADGGGLGVPPENNAGVNARPNAIVDLWGSADFVLDEFGASDPPVMIVHGFLDTQLGTFYAVALRIAAACEDAGIPFSFITFFDQGHGAWEGMSDGKNLSELVLEFLGTYLD